MKKIDFSAERPHVIFILNIFLRIIAVNIDFAGTKAHIDDYWYTRDYWDIHLTIYYSGTPLNENSRWGLPIRNAHG